MARPGAWGKFCLPTIHAVLLVASPYIMCQGIVLDIMQCVHNITWMKLDLPTGWVMSVPLGEGNYR